MSALAGRFAPRADATPDEWRPRLEASLRPDGTAVSLSAGALSVAWVPASGSNGAVVCLLDGRPRTAPLAAALGLDPSQPPDQHLAVGWERLGEAVLERLGGDYTLLLWDRARRRGLLARDRLGARPLFVAESEGALLFASEIRNLLALMPARPVPDGTAMAQWLARTSPRSDRTLYAGIRRVPAAFAIRLSEAGWERWRHWRPRYQPPRKLTVDDAAEELRDGIERAVRRALDGTERPGVMLSGGFDSGAVAGSAGAVLAGGGLRAYSSVFPEDPAVDESSNIARTREWVGVPFVEAAFVAGSPLAAGIEFMTEWQVPSVTPNLFIWLPLLRRAAADGVDVMLDGEGGDELFGCAPYLVADRLRAGRLLAAVRLARRLPGMGEHPRPRLIRRALLRYGVRPAIPYRLHEPLRRPRREARLADWLGPEARREHRIGDDPWGWKREAGPRWWAHLSDLLTTAVDALGAADQLRREADLCGLAFRHPLRDQELVDLVLTLPPELAFDPHLDRPVARRAMAGALPPEVLGDDAKPVFNSLLTTSLQARDLEALRTLLASPHPELARRIRRQAVASMIEGPGPATRPRTWGLDLWRLGSLALWLEYQADTELPDRIAETIDSRPAIAFTERRSVVA